MTAGTAGLGSCRRGTGFFRPRCYEDLPVSDNPQHKSSTSKSSSAPAEHQDHVQSQTNRYASIPCSMDAAGPCLLQPTRALAPAAFGIQSHPDMTLSAGSSSGYSLNSSFSSPDSTFRSTEGWALTPRHSSSGLSGFSLTPRTSNSCLSAPFNLVGAQPDNSLAQLQCQQQLQLQQQQQQQIMMLQQQHQFQQQQQQQQQQQVLPAQGCYEVVPVVTLGQGLGQMAPAHAPALEHGLADLLLLQQQEVEVDAAIDDLITLRQQLTAMHPRAALPAVSQASMIPAAPQQLVYVEAPTAQPQQQQQLVYMEAPTAPQQQQQLVFVDPSVSLPVSSPPVIINQQQLDVLPFVPAAAAAPLPALPAASADAQQLQMQLHLQMRQQQQQQLVQTQAALQAELMHMLALV